MEKLRLLLFEDCPRNCEGCCLKDWDLENLPVVQDYIGYDMVMLTGGEPLLKSHIIYDTVVNIRNQNENAKIILYTAMLHDYRIFRSILKIVDGITLTLHDQTDVEDFRILCNNLDTFDIFQKSMRLNIFKDVFVDFIPYYWKIKHNIEWIKDCPLPEGEVFMRLPKGI